MVIYKFENKALNYKPHEEILIEFSAISSSKEITLLLNFPHKNYNSSQGFYPDESFELVIGGGDEHDTTWLSIYNTKRAWKGRVQSVSTPNILSHEELRTFWIRIGNKVSKSPGDSYLEFGKGPSHMPPIISWPVRHKFILCTIAVKLLPGIPSNIK